MSGPVILVDGLPGAGKTTLARVLARAFRLPLFSYGGPDARSPSVG